MREFECTIAGKALVLAATFKASLQIAEKVADPFFIARESMLEQSMLDRGYPYTPGFTFTVENVPLILYIGLKAAKANYTLEEVQDLVFEEGFADCRDFAIGYIGLLLGPSPEVDLPDEDSEGN